MVLPTSREGVQLIGPAAGSWLAEITVEGRADTEENVDLIVREAEDGAAVALTQHVAEASVRRQLLFVSLPDGRCLTAERLDALRDVRVSSLRQGRLSIINDEIFCGPGEGPPCRHVRWQGGEATFEGFPAGGAAETELSVSLTPGEPFVAWPD
jgi:hypothetical protein